MRMIDVFMEAVKKHGQEIALRDTEKTITYEEFDRLTNQVAFALQVEKNEIIGLHFEKSISYLIALFAVMKKGNPFVTLNQQLPKERLDYMVQTLSLQTILDSSFVETVLSKAEETVFEVSTDYHMDDVAYMIFTSGSTGNPKGVQVTHRGLYNVIGQQIEMFQLNKEANMLLTNSISFDASLSDIFTTLLSGATLCMDLESKNIIQTVKEFEITHLDISPSVLNVMYEEIAIPTMKTIVVGGELLSPQAISYLSRKLKLVNVYGPTEVTICNTMKVMQEGDEPNCIGNPIEGVTFHLIDGELVIESEACADGYYGLQSDSFYQQDGKRFYKTGDYAEYKEGEYYFLGRKDRQVKIKGFRLELEEIEILLKKETKVDNVAVLFEGKKLVCFSTQQIDKKKVTTLPYYMIPDLFFVIPAFTLNSNGKIDYHVLRNMLKQQRNESIIEVFSEVFEKEVTLEDTWHTLGGDSLDMVHVMVALEEASFHISVEDILSGCSIRELMETHRDTTTLPVSYLQSTIEPVTFEEYEAKEVEKEHVLLTGATGYLASHFLEKLLQEQKEEEYYCLVRTNSQEEAYEKLKQTFIKYDLDTSLLDKEHVHIVLGDISKENFGMKTSDYEFVQERITKVVHSAAMVNNLLPYQSMFDTNVKGTLEVIKLGKPIHYISTLSVFVGTDKNTGVVYEEDDLSTITTAYGGYAQSKYMAEYLIRQSNLPYVCYRFGLITGHTKKKQYHEKEFITMFLKGLMAYKQLPNIDMDQMIVDISPIDFCVDVMKDVYEKGSYYETYHIANTEGASLTLLYEAMKESGIAIEVIEVEDFKQSILSNELDVNIKTMLLTLCRFDEELFEKYRYCDLFQRTGIEFDMKHTLEITNASFPKVDKTLIKHYIESVK